MSRISSNLPRSMSDYLVSGQFEEDIRKHTDASKFGTGFPLLDAHEPLDPGLYVLCGYPNVGKVDFAYQVAEQMAERGRRVLFFSFETYRFCLVSKSLARQFYLGNKDNETELLNFSDIMCGNVSRERIKEAEKSLQARIGKSLTIIDKEFPCTTAAIEETIGKYIDADGQPPCIILDTLRPLIAECEAGSDREASAIRVVKELKRISRTHNMVVFFVSNLNEEDVCEESEEIKYIADAVWEMELNYSEAQMEEVCLTCNKDRGEPRRYSVRFQHDMVTGMFSEAADQKLENADAWVAQWACLGD